MALPDETVQRVRGYLAGQSTKLSLSELVAKVRGDEHPEAALQHQWFGPLTWRETLLVLRLHDQDHAGQLQTIAAPRPPNLPP